MVKQKNRKTEKQKNRKTEKQKNRKTEKQRSEFIEKEKIDAVCIILCLYWQKHYEISLKAGKRFAN
nr:hypothetical protein [Providencia rettgeri]